MKTALYASVGATLTHYELDVEGYALVKRGTVPMPGKIKNAWPHSSLPILYAGCSPLKTAPAGSSHQLCAFRIDRQTGALSPHGEAIPLPARACHLSTDSQSEHVLVAFHPPAGLGVFRINPDGTPGDTVAQREGMQFGPAPHQVRVSADNRMVILVARGHPSKVGDNRNHLRKQNDPGALNVFEYRQGVLGKEVSIAPGDGYSFGPRNLDFHPRGPWIYVTLTTQNKLMVFRRNGNSLDAEPLFTKDILSHPDDVPMRQGAGPQHMSPDGRFLYCVNRGKETVEENGRQVVAGADNTLAVYSIDPGTGEPHLIQHIDSRGIRPSAIAVDPGGRMLVAANALTRLVREGGTVRQVSANLAVFRILEDGRLEFVRTYDVETGPSGGLDWTGMLTF